MSWEELYPVVKTQAGIYAVLRYEEPERRKDKIQELVCQSYEKYKNDSSKKKKLKNRNTNISLLLVLSSPVGR